VSLFQTVQDKIWTINKRQIDPIAPRYTAITLENAAELHLTNFDGDDSAPQVVEVPLHPKNAAVGSKAVTRSSKVLLEQDDAKLIKEGEEVRNAFANGTSPSLRFILSCCVVILMKNRLWLSYFNSMMTRLFAKNNF
jgi:hypothetical protein